jgi:hypothetical protein
LFSEERSTFCRALTVIVVITHDDLLDLAKLAHLTPEVLIEGIEMVLELRGVHLVLGVVGWVLVEVGEKNGLRVGGLDMFAGAAIAVATRSDLVVERTVNLNS